MKPGNIFAAVMLLWHVGTALPAEDMNVLLTVVTPAQEEIQFDRAALEAMPQTEFTTTTIWTDGPQTFRGVPFAELLARLGTQPGHITLIAANGYRVERVPEELGIDGALLAYLRNGEEMSLREKGPLWLVYNYDADPGYRTEVIYANSIWQLDRIEIAD